MEGLLLLVRVSGWLACPVVEAESWGVGKGQDLGLVNASVSGHLELRILYSLGGMVKNTFPDRALEQRLRRSYHRGSIVY